MIEFLLTGEYFEVRGHSPKSKDHLCMAVSVLTQHVANLLKVEYGVSIEKGKGYLRVWFPERKDECSVKVISALVRSLQELEKLFPNALKVEVKYNGP